MRRTSFSYCTSTHPQCRVEGCWVNWWQAVKESSLFYAAHCQPNKNIIFYALLQYCEKWPLALSCLSIHLHGTQLVPDGFSWNLVFEYFLKIYGEKKNFIEIWQEERILDMKTYTFMIVSCCILLRMRNVSGKNCRENENTFYIQ